ncbi:adhesion G-protein coupled receptor G1 [Ornithorhynchus anatinus]|uniref:adhesion G-protein coupled receptor G1 n=1 Tax=Ornithorhynchus anatinus TaxID=9258 RepID=UPI0010A83AD1|nr:adhesion G-protein coupled receptor G1 [Ornithorhynchus anatinus]XP_028931453.1 adhesion G-protein coupled receptor G1 [Ornithorhynchus anatinus]XP_028931454.1 adhesion G-protein coupled receptor G1 [Ornithorhynchus anatinus]XP_028931455.1 adhesion G-protein coupled receptor G1 [Ornithorhynchus anatinus]XP_028931456.1 adhesion G-protein coupled receptor G1 [Ornithorhynchus anatinus]
MQPWSERQGLGLLMFFWQLGLFVLIQGVPGSRNHKEDFIFCGQRNQTEDSSLIYQKGNATHITIENNQSLLKITAPFDPNSNRTTFPPQKGIYHFCIYWFQRMGIFNITYGKNTYMLSNMANEFLCFDHPGENRSKSPALLSTSFSSWRLPQNTTLPNAAVYTFNSHAPSTASSSTGSTNLCDLEKELKLLSSFMSSPLKARRMFSQNTVNEHLQSLESKLAAVPFQGERVSFEEENVNATVWKINSSFSPQDLHLNSKMEKDQKEVQGYSLTLPRKLFEMSKGRQGRTEKRLLLVDFSSQALFQDKNSSQVLGEKVLGIVVHGSKVVDLPEPVVLTFHHQPQTKTVTLRCMFWVEDSASHGSGNWNDSGCSTEVGERQTTCLCNHLTYFAVLMVSALEIDVVHKHYLTTISYVGCIISAIACTLTIGFYLFSRRKQRREDYTIKVHMNLLLAVFFLDISFLLSEPVALLENEVACRTSAIFLHFSFLACLTWMGLEGYNLYRLVIEVFRTYVPHYLTKLCVLGWGLPLLLVLVTVLVDGKNYGSFTFTVQMSSQQTSHPSMCWLTDPVVSYVMNLGFFCLVFLFNAIMLIIMTVQIFKLNHQRGDEWHYVLTLLGLSLLLGIPWGLVFFAFTSGTFQLVVLYLFSIITSFQGFLIFLWYWSMQLQAKASSPLKSTSDSVKLQSGSHTSSYRL